jgi:hypothetical protein
MRRLAGTGAGNISPIALGAAGFAAGAMTLAGILLVQVARGPDWDVGAAACRDDDGPFQIPSDWVEPGETRFEVRRHLASLPLIGQDRHGDGGLVVLADERFVRICVIHDSSLGSAANPVATDVRAPIGDGDLAYLWETADGGGHQVGGEGPIVEAGLVGADVARVDVVREDGSRVTAAVADGIWVAWWAERLSGASIEAYAADGSLIGEIADGVSIGPSPPSPSRRAVAGLCLGQIESVPEEWRLPGEDFSSSLERVQALPLVIAHESEGSYLFGDETSWALCTVDPHEDPEQALGVTWGPREEPAQPVQVLSGGEASDPFAAPSFAMAGAATGEVARVLVILDGGSEVEADVGGGYWLASWNENEDGVVLKAYDVGGDLLIETAAGP